MFQGQLGLQLIIPVELALLHIHQNDLTWLQPALFPYFRGFEGLNTNFRSHDHQIVLGDDVAGRAQPVAVQHSPEMGFFWFQDSGIRMDMA